MKCVFQTHSVSFVFLFLTQFNSNLYYANLGIRIQNCIIHWLHACISMNDIIIGESHWKYRGKSGGTQCYSDGTDGVLRIYRVLDAKRDLLLSQLLRLHHRLCWLVLLLH